MKKIIVFIIAMLTLAISLQSYAVSTDYYVRTSLPFKTLAKWEPIKGAYLSSYILQDETIKMNINTWDELTGKHHASYFKYVGWGKPFPTEWVNELKEKGAVPHIAWEPNNGLDEVQDNQYLHDFAKACKDTGVPIFLRYASEMNGTWTFYSGKSELYKEKWKLVHNVMKDEAPNVAMVWTVFTNPQSTILKFYPGDQYVDWVGVNIYNVQYHNNDLNSPSAHEDPLLLLDYVYNTFSLRKPIQVSEFGATHYSVTDDQYYADWAADKITRFYKGLAMYYPRVKSVYYFDVNNIANAPTGRKVNDYSVTNDPTVLNAYKNAVSTTYFLTNVDAKTSKIEKTNQLVTMHSQIFLMNNQWYISIDALRSMFGFNLIKNKNSYELVKNGMKLTVIPKSDQAFQGYGLPNSSTIVVPLVSMKAFGYSILIQKNKNIIDIIMKK